MCDKVSPGVYICAREFFNILRLAMNGDERRHHLKLQEAWSPRACHFCVSVIKLIITIPRDTCDNNGNVLGRRLWDSQICASSLNFEIKIEANSD